MGSPFMTTITRYVVFFLAQLKISLTTSIHAQTYVQYNTKRKKMDPSCRYQIGIKEARVRQNVPRGYGYYRGIAMVLKTGPGREPERGVVPVSLVRPGSDRWSNR